MPRVAKPKATLSGDKPQPISAVAGQEYGMGQAQMDLQRALPAPNVQAPPTTAGVPPSDVTSTTAQPGAPAQPSPLDAMQAAQQMAGGDGLFHQAPTSGHVITAGLPSGPGPGPEIMGPSGPTPFGRTMQMLSETTGDPIFAQLARRNGIL